MRLNIKSITKLLSVTKTVIICKPSTWYDQRFSFGLKCLNRLNFKNQKWFFLKYMICSSSEPVWHINTPPSSQCHRSQHHKLSSFQINFLYRHKFRWFESTWSLYGFDFRVHQSIYERVSVIVIKQMGKGMYQIRSNRLLMEIQKFFNVFKKKNKVRSKSCRGAPTNHTSWILCIFIWFTQQLN